MASRTDLAAVLIVADFAIGSALPVSGETIVEAKTWDDAISKLECKDINKNADGSFSVSGIIKINGEDQYDPIINVAKYKEEVEAKKC
jgi:uncharacterized protein YdaT